MTMSEPLEESKESQKIDPNVLYNDIQSKLKAFIGDQDELLMKEGLEQISDDQSEKSEQSQDEVEEEDDSYAYQSQLRHLVKACIYPYKNYSKKFIREFG